MPTNNYLHNHRRKITCIRIYKHARVAIKTSRYWNKNSKFVRAVAAVATIMENCNFINNSLFEAALSDYFKEKVEVVGFKAATAVMKGDNYTSDTFKISVAFRRKTKG